MRTLLAFLLLCTIAVLKIVTGSPVDLQASGESSAEQCSAGFYYSSDKNECLRCSDCTTLAAITLHPCTPTADTVCKSCELIAPDDTKLYKKCQHIISKNDHKMQKKAGISQLDEELSNDGTVSGTFADSAHSKDEKAQVEDKKQENDSTNEESTENTNDGSNKPTWINTQKMSVSLDHTSDETDDASSNGARHAHTLSLETLLNSSCISVYESEYFTTPNYPADYPPDAELCWSASCDPGTVATLVFHDFCTESGFDYVYVYDGSSTNASDVLALDGCSTQVPLPQVASGTDMLIGFSSDHIVHMRGFRASYECLNDTLCNTVDEAEYFSSPGYPSYYEDNTELCWKATCPAETVLTLTFHDFCTETHFDRVQLYDGSFTNGSAIKTFDGCVTPPPQVAAGPVMFITFSSDVSITRRGFRASYECVYDDSCTSVYEGEMFTTPGYPSSYPDDLELCWIASCPIGMVVTLTFDDFCTESYHDELILYDGATTNSSLIAVLDGCNVPITQASTTTDMLITFSSDGSVSYRGFSASYQCFASTACTSVVEGEVFHSPGYPSSYPNSFETCWEASCASGKEVSVSFNDFCTESGSDELRLYDDTSNTGSILMTLEGCSTDPPEVVKGTDMRIVFNSDHQVSMRGFSAHYQCTGDIVCNTVEEGQLFNTTGYPSEYPNDSEICWEASCSQGRVLTLTFHDFCTESYHDPVHLYSSSSTNETFIVTLEGCNTPPPQVATGTEMRVHFTSDGSITRRGFLASYECILDV